MVTIDTIHIKLFFLAISCCISLVGFGQKDTLLQPQRGCAATTQIQKEWMKADSSYAKHARRWDDFLSSRFARKAPDCANGPIIIPVAIHFQGGVVPAGSEACARGLAIEQISILNQEINGVDPDNVAYANFQSCLAPIGAACIEFSIASQSHPAGYGLNEGDLAITFGKINFDNRIPMSVIPLDSNWEGYLNIFVGNLPNDIFGQSPIPGDISQGYGLSIRACSFGSGNFKCNGFNNSTTCGGLFNEGETLTHEIGHYFGLFHIFGDGGCDRDDYLGDTPTMDSDYEEFTGCGNHTSCNDLPSSCGSRDMYMNYMSYSADQCMYMFTSEQADQMYQTAKFLGFSTDVPAVCSSEKETICMGSDYTYAITNVNSGLVLEVNEASVAIGANVQQGSSNNTIAQQWYFKDVGNGQYAIINVSSGLALDVNGASTATGANIQQWNDNGSGAQKWSLQNIDKDQYFITNVNSGLVLDVDGGSMELGANVKQWEVNGSGAQLWQLNRTAGNCHSNDNRIQAKVFLEGFFNGTTGLTKNSDHATLIPNSQPFNTAPWNYRGTESVTTLPANVVDWVLIVTRTVNGTIQEQQAGFITTTGELMSTDGTMGIPFNNIATYFSIHHKSHLAVMSATPYTDGVYDFTTSITQAMGNNQLKAQNGKYVLHCGDYDGNGNINAADFNLWNANSAVLNQYMFIDGDGNGVINATDYNLWVKNKSKLGHSPLQYN